MSSEGYYGQPLVKKGGNYYVAVSHQELDNLVGRLMQMCELTGDVEQRRALKSEIKMRSRAWLDDIYSSSGCDNFEGIREGAEVLESKSTLERTK